MKREQGFVKFLLVVIGYWNLCFNFSIWIASREVERFFELMSTTHALPLAVHAYVDKTIAPKELIQHDENAKNDEYIRHFFVVFFRKRKKERFLFPPSLHSLQTKREKCITP